MTDKLLRGLDRLLWLVVIVLALAFVLIKIRNWGPLPAMEQRDFAVYYLGGVAIQMAPHTIYQPELALASTGMDLPLAGPYLYAPTIAWLFTPFGHFAYPQAALVWLAINTAVAAAIFLLVTQVWSDRRASFLGALLWLLLPATLDTMFLGNVNLVLALLVTACVWAFGRSRAMDALGGLALGLAAGIKPFLLGLILAGIWARRWGFVIMAGIGTATSILLVFPFYSAVYPAYWHVLAQCLAEFAPPSNDIIQNQSVFGTLQKLAYRGTIVLTAGNKTAATLTFTPLIAPSMARLYALICAAAIGVVLLWALGQLDRRRADAVMLTWCLLLTSMLILSPVSWMLYVVIIAPLYPALLILRQQLSPGWRLLIPLGYLAILAQRGYALWLPYIPVLALTSTILVGVFAWWLIFVRSALLPVGLHDTDTVPARNVATNNMHV